jgi:uncharacterized protein
MTISMYQASVPVFQRMIKNLDGILDKAAAWAATRKIEPLVLLQARLAPDMFALVRQVQIVTDNAKGAPARLAGLKPPVFEDNETSFAELKTRLQKTLTFLDSLKPAQIDGSEARDIVLKLGPREVTFKGQEYLLGFAIPNTFFHYSMSYAILRHNGLDLGKPDFLGAS